VLPACRHHDHGPCSGAAPIFDGQWLPCASVGISGSDRDRVLSMVDKVKLAAEVITHVLAPSRPG